MIKTSEQEVKEALNRIAKTDDGKVMLSWMKHLCNWDMTLMGNDPVLTQHHASIRGVWGKVRQSIHTDELKAIEHDYVMVQEVSKPTKKAGK